MSGHRCVAHPNCSAVDLLAKLLVFDPASRITVQEALEHPWLAAYHDVSDEPPCPAVFERWRDIEKLETLPEFREAIWNEIQDYRKEVRSIYFDASDSIDRSPSIRRQPRETTVSPPPAELLSPFELKPPAEAPRVQSPDYIGAAREVVSPEPTNLLPVAETETEATATELPPPTSQSERSSERPPSQIADPVMTYVRRSSFLQQASRANSMYSTYAGRTRHSVAYYPESRSSLERGQVAESSIAFPTQQEYVVPARSRTASTFGDTVTRRLLRTLSTVSIYESGEGLAGGLADIAPIGKYIVERDEALPSGMPQELESQSPSQPRSQPKSQSPPQPQSQPQSHKSQDSGQKEGRDKTRFHIQE